MSKLVTLTGYDRQGKRTSVSVEKPAKDRLIELRRKERLKEESLKTLFRCCSDEKRQKIQSIISPLPPILKCDVDLHPSKVVDSNPPPGEYAWLVGGNLPNQIGDTLPDQEYLLLGIDTPSTSTLTPDELFDYLNLGIDVVTSGETRILIQGDAINDPDYAECMDGRVMIANGFIEAFECPVDKSIIPSNGDISDTLKFGGAILDIYLERPSNAYSMIFTQEELEHFILVPDNFPLVELRECLELAGSEPLYTLDNLNFFFEQVNGEVASFVDAYTTLTDAATTAGIIGVLVQDEPGFRDLLSLFVPFFGMGVVPGQRVVFVNNIFVGDKPQSTPSSVVSYVPSASNVQPDENGRGSKLFTKLSVLEYSYLLRVVSQGEGFALVFRYPEGFAMNGETEADFRDGSGTSILSNASMFSISPLGFFQMRYTGNDHIMLSNVQYNSTLL